VTFSANGNPRANDLLSVIGKLPTGREDSFRSSDGTIIWQPEMTSKVLYLFPDTNLFIQCRPLEQLDWSGWKDFDEVHLIVSRPIQSEIDNQKKRGNDRVGKRARTVAGLFKKLILEADKQTVIAEGASTVRLIIRPELKRSKELEEQLDYSQRDDQLVGIAREFRDNNPNADVRVLTHDGGPLATAKMVGVPVAPIPDDLLLEPETTDTEKKLNALTTELARLKKAEPQFEISCLDVTSRDKSRHGLTMTHASVRTQCGHSFRWRNT
jgi:predicted ribonuclease YlaK